MVHAASRGKFFRTCLARSQDSPPRRETGRHPFLSQRRPAPSCRATRRSTRSASHLHRERRATRHWPKCYGRAIPMASVERSQGIGPARPRRRRIPDRPEVGIAGEPDRTAAARLLVCNADEGDPGAYMDRSVLEGNPHSIIEGMLIGRLSPPALLKAWFMCAPSIPLAIKHLVIALRQAREIGLLGHDILGTGFSFDIEIVKGAGAFVCGEETALMRSIEGERGEPRQRPPILSRKESKASRRRSITSRLGRTFRSSSCAVPASSRRPARPGTPGPRSSAWSGR